MRNYYRDELSNPLSSNSESFKYNTSIIGNTHNVGAGEDGYDAHKIGKNNTEVVEVELILTWSKNCVLADMTERGVGNNNDPPALIAPIKI